MRGPFLLALMLLLHACAPAVDDAVVSRASIDGAPSSLPPMKNFAAGAPRSTPRSNNDLSLDFIELSFRMESGKDLRVLTRFEGPITIRVTGAAPTTLGPDLARLISRLRTEARIDISPTTSTDANITIEAVSRSQIRQVLPQAACFVAPNVTSLKEYRKARRTARTDWAQMSTRQQVAIFLPNDVSPQEIRDCLHEEVAQALGPLNDLYRLPDSVFNDDNVHTVLTGFDMMVLRAYYDPTLHSGMSRGRVANALPGILARINPRGTATRARYVTRTPQEWKTAIQRALGPGQTAGRRQNAAYSAIKIAERLGWQDHRRAFAHYAMGRALQSGDPEAAHKQYQLADQFYARNPGTDLHRAYVATQLGAYAITQGNGAEALRIIGPHVQTAMRRENAALLSTLLLLRAEALELENRPAEARLVRLDSLGWARYGFGTDWAVRAKMGEIASLNPLK
ncbi:Protein of unknown function [Sulfitobacter marinus]|uniref:ATP-dependent transcriptional regulator n=1 Tax=Sulfitobacter marinus TaxID=394264 RepID=A0A1I6QEX1_9RHOB|nr:DUF2927 domain-containing protein [Sulfitobacter marinus]SFS51039.1 Protein of unknown function [Sulfitobacter marinus]